MSSDLQRRREVTLLLIVFAIPALVFWAVTVEAVVTLSRAATIVAGVGALACTLGYVGLAWRAHAKRRAVPAPMPPVRVKAVRVKATAGRSRATGLSTRPLSLTFR